MSAILDYLTDSYESLNEFKETEDFQSRHSQVNYILICTLILTVVLELWSLPTVKQLWKQQPNGKELYLKGLFWNLFNQYALGVPAYSIAGTMLTSSTYHYGSDGYITFVLKTMVEIVWVWAIHGVGYYYIHKAFHESPKLYKYHKFHHRFNTYVPPSAANAVEPVEYLLAYLLPFVIAVIAWPVPGQLIHYNNLAIATSVISAANILVHTPKLEGKYMGHHHQEDKAGKSWTQWLVSTEDHLNHHRKLKCHYASPTFNIDNMVSAMNDATTSTSK